VLAATRSKHSTSQRTRPRDDLRDRLTATMGDESGDESDGGVGFPPIVMAANRFGSKMGCAYFTAAESKLCIFEDLELSPDYYDACELLPPDCGRE
jgi:hypothetical protein